MAWHKTIGELRINPDVESDFRLSQEEKRLMEEIDPLINDARKLKKISTEKLINLRDQLQLIRNNPQTTSTSKGEDGYYTQKLLFLNNAIDNRAKK